MNAHAIPFLLVVMIAACRSERRDQDRPASSPSNGESIGCRLPRGSGRPWATGARLVPDLQNGRFRGMRLYSLDPKGALFGAGLRNGDLVLTADGQSFYGQAVAQDAPEVNLVVARDSQHLHFRCELR
jgi:hypothetical protein